MSTCRRTGVFFMPQPHHLALWQGLNKGALGKTFEPCRPPTARVGHGKVELAWRAYSEGEPVFLHGLLASVEAG
jgi:hypothetical protein